jgi:hypothetical protein
VDVSAVTIVVQKEVQLGVLGKGRVGERGEITRDWYGKIECGVNETCKRGACFEKKIVLISRHSVFGILWFVV